MAIHMNNRQSTSVLNNVTQPIDDYERNVTHPNNTRVFQPKLIVSDQSKKHGSMYVNALREALFTHFEKPYKAPEVPLSIIQQGDNVSKYICRQCKDCFHHQTSLEEHIFRGSWILGYWCTDCFQECEHLAGKKLYCAKCIKLQIQKYKALQGRGLKRRNDPGIVKIFFNPCQLLEHMQMHNSEDIAVHQLMLLPFPSGIGKEYFPHLKMISEALMDFMFLANIHIADWLVQNKIHKWWRMAKGDNPVANIIKKYPFEVQQIKQLLNCNSKGNQISKSNLNIATVSIHENKKNISYNKKHSSSRPLPNLMISNSSQTDNTSNIQSDNHIAFIDCGPCDNEQSYSTDKQSFDDSSNTVGDLSNLTNAVTIGTNQAKISTSKAKISVKKFAKVPASPVRSNSVNETSPSAGHSSRINATANHRVVTIHSAKPVNLSSIIKNFPQISDAGTNNKIVFIHKNLPQDVNLTNLNNLQNNEVQNVDFYSNRSSKDQNIENQKIIHEHELQQSGLLLTKIESLRSRSNKVIIKPVDQQNHKDDNKNKTIIKKVYRPIKPKQVQKKKIVKQKLNTEDSSAICTQTKENSDLFLATLKSTTKKILEQFFQLNELTFLTANKNEKSGKTFLSVTYKNNDSSTDQTIVYRTKFFSNISKISRSKIHLRINHIKAISRKFSDKIGFANNEIVKGHQKLISILENIAIYSDSSSQFVDDYFGPLVNLTSNEVCTVCHKVKKSTEYIVGFTNVATDTDYCLCYDFICYKCKTFQGNRERFEAHLRYHTIGSPFVCPECNISFSTFRSLNVHVWTECFHPFIMRFLTCNICEIGGFCSLESIINHFVVMHSIKMAACNFCCMVFEYKRFCISHMKKGHSESKGFNKPLLLASCQLDDKVIPIECYNLHIQNHKCFQESYFYNCNLCSCNKVFITKELIKTHIYKCHYSELSSFIDAESLSEILLKDDIQQLVEENLTINKSDMNLVINNESIQTIQTLKTTSDSVTMHHLPVLTRENVKTNNTDSKKPTSIVNQSNSPTNSENEIPLGSELLKESYKKNKNTGSKYGNSVDLIPNNDVSSNNIINSHKQLALNKECKITGLDAVQSNQSHIELITSVAEENLNAIEARNQECTIPDKLNNIEHYSHETLMDENSEIQPNSDQRVDSVSEETSEKMCIDSENPEFNIATHSSQLATEANVSFNDIINDNNKSDHCKETSKTSGSSVEENTSALISEELNAISRIIVDSDSSPDLETVNASKSVKEHNRCDLSVLKESDTISITEKLSAREIKEDKQFEHITNISDNITTENKSTELDNNAVNRTELFNIHENVNIDSTNLKPNNEENTKDLLAEEKDRSLRSVDEDKTQNISNSSEENSNLLQIQQLKHDKSKETHVTTPYEKSNKNESKEMSSVPLEEQDNTGLKNLQSVNVEKQKAVEYPTAGDTSEMDDSHEISNDSISIRNEDARLVISQTHDYIAKHNYFVIRNKDDDNVEDVNGSRNTVDDKKQNDAKANSNLNLLNLTYEGGHNKEIQKPTDNLKLPANIQSKSTEKKRMASNRDSMPETQIIQEKLTYLDKYMELQDDRIHINQYEQFLNEPAESSAILITDMNNSNFLTDEIPTSKDIRYKDVQNTKRQTLVYEAFEEQNVYENNSVIDSEELINEKTKSILIVNDDRIDNETRKESFNNDTESCVKNDDKKNSKILPTENRNALEECINTEQEVDIELVDENNVHSLMEQKSLSDSDTIEESKENLENNELLVAKESTILDQCMSLDNINNDLKDKGNIVHRTDEKIPVSDRNILQECKKMNDSLTVEETNKLDINNKKDQMNIFELETFKQINESSTVQQNNLLDQRAEENKTNINNSPVKVSSIECEHIKEVNENLDKLDQCIVEKSRIIDKSSPVNEKLEHALIEGMPVSDKDVGEYEHFKKKIESVKVVESNELEQHFDKEGKANPRISSVNGKLSISNIIEEGKHVEVIKESVTIEKSDKTHQCINAEIQSDDKSMPDIEKVVHSFIEEIAESNGDIISEFENFEGIDESVMIEQMNKVDQCIDEAYAHKKCLPDNENIEHSFTAELSVSDQNVINESENFEKVNEFVSIDENNKLDQSFDKKNEILPKSIPDNEKSECSLFEQFSLLTRDISEGCEHSEAMKESVMTGENDKLDQLFDKEDQTNEINSADNGTIEHSLIEDMLEAGRAVNKECERMDKINESVILEKGNESSQSFSIGRKIIETNLTADEKIIQLAIEKNLVSDTSIGKEHENININNDSIDIECVHQSISVTTNVNNYNTVKLVIEPDSEKILLKGKITEIEDRSSDCINSKSNIDNEEISNLIIDSFKNSNYLNIDQLTVKENHKSITADEDEAVLETVKQSNSKELIFPSSIKVNITTDKINIDTLSGNFISDNLTSEKNKIVLKDLTLKTQISSCSNKESFELQNIKNTDTEGSEVSDTSTNDKQIDILIDSCVKNNKNDSVDNFFLFSNVSSSAETSSTVVESNIVTEDSNSLDLAISGKQSVEKTNTFIEKIDDLSSKNILPDITEKEGSSTTEKVIKCNEYELNNLSLTDDEKINLSKNSINSESQVENSVNVKRLRSRSCNKLNSSNSEMIKTKRKCKIKATTEQDKTQNLTEKNSKKSRLETNVVDSVDITVREKKLGKTQKAKIRKTRSKSKRRKEDNLKDVNVHSDNNKSISSDAEEAKIVNRSHKRKRSENIVNTGDQKVKPKESLLMQMPTLRLIKTSTRSSPVNFSDFPEKAPKLRAVKKHKIGFDNSTNVSAKVYKFKCHLCGDAISTSWSIISDHYNKKHAHNYELCIISPKLIRLSDEDVNKNERKNDKKRKSSEVSLTNLKKKKRLSPKKVNEKIWISSDRTSGLFVQLESVIDGEGHFKCKKCDERCIDMAELRQHIIDNHRIAKKNLICLECGENFVVSPSLQMHLKAFHGIEDPVAYMNKYPAYAPDIDDFEEDAKTTAANQCHVCMAVFKDKLSVDKHLRVHGMAFLSKKRREARNAELSKVEKFDKDHLNSSTNRASQETQRNKAANSTNSDKASNLISSR